MASPNRDQMKAASGKVLKSDDTILDVSAILVKLDAVLSASTGLKVNADINVGDIEIGAVEMKDGDTDTRSNIKPANTARTNGTVVLATQPIDEAGNVLGKTPANTARTTGTTVQPSQAVDPAGNVITLETVGADAESNTSKRVPTSARLKSFNGATWDALRSGQITPTATLTGFLNALTWAIFNAAPTSRTEGQGGPLQADANGNLLDSMGTALYDEDATNNLSRKTQAILTNATYSPTPFQNLGANATLNIKATAGNVVSFCCHNVSGLDGYFQFHNTATTPAGAAVPALTFFVPAGGVCERGTEFFTAAGRNFATGIAFAFSLTEATYTAAPAAAHITHVNFN